MFYVERVVYVLMKRQMSIAVVGYCYFVNRQFISSREIKKRGNVMPSAPIVA